MKRILILDDDDDMLRLFPTLLEREGWKTFAAPTVREAIRILAANWDGLDAAVLDYCLPDGKGTDLFKAVLRPARQICLYTATTFHAHEEQAILSLGVDGIYRKPNGLWDLLAALGCGKWGTAEETAGTNRPACGAEGCA